MKPNFSTMTCLSRAHKLQMERTTLPKSVNKINWLLPVYLTWYSLNNLLDVQDGLEHLDICLPVTSQLMAMGSANSEGTDITLVVISNSFFPCSIPLFDSQ